MGGAFIGSIGGRRDDMIGFEGTTLMLNDVGSTPHSSFHQGPIACFRQVLKSVSSLKSQASIIPPPNLLRTTLSRILNSFMLVLRVHIEFGGAPIPFGSMERRRCRLTCCLDGFKPQTGRAL